MNLLSRVEFVLAVSPGLWACLALFWWLWCHHRIHVPRYVGPRRNPIWRSAAPRHPRAKPDWVRKEIVYLASHLRGCRTIAMTFNARYGPAVRVGKTWVAEIVRQCDEEIRQLRRERRRRPPVRITVRHTWALDLTYWRTSHGATFTILALLDAGSRKLLRLRVLSGKNVHLILAQLHAAFGEHGLPVAIRTDNESMFTSKAWLATLQGLAILHRRGPPMQPWRNGRVERLIGTLKQALRQVWIESAQGLQAALDEFTLFYNFVRRHSALGGLTPEEAWQGRTLAAVQQAFAMRGGQWVAALGGGMVAYGPRC